MPKVSIVLPTYNGSCYLAQAIESCLAQTYLDLELIIVVDGSTDATPSILTQFTDNRLQIIWNEKNQGLPASLNIGFAHTTGQYLTWTSDDNFYAPHALERMVKSLENNQQIDFVYADYWLIDTEGQLIDERKVKPPYFLKEESCIGACFLYSRQVYETIGNYNSHAKLIEDYEYWLRVYQRFQMMPIHEPLYFYRTHSQSLTKKHGAHHIKRLSNTMKKNLGVFSKQEYCRAMAYVDIDEGFLYYQQGKLVEARHLLWRGVKADWQWTKNLGIWSIILQSYGLRSRYQQGS